MVLLPNKLSCWKGDAFWEAGIEKKGTKHPQNNPSRCQGCQVSLSFLQKSHLSHLSNHRMHPCPPLMGRLCPRNLQPTASTGKEELEQGKTSCGMHPSLLLLSFCGMHLGIPSFFFSDALSPFLWDLLQSPPFKGGTTHVLILFFFLQDTLTAPLFSRRHPRIPFSFCGMHLHISFIQDLPTHPLPLLFFWDALTHLLLLFLGCTPTSSSFFFCRIHSHRSFFCGIDSQSSYFQDALKHLLLLFLPPNLILCKDQFPPGPLHFPTDPNSSTCPKGGATCTQKTLLRIFLAK